VGGSSELRERLVPPLVEVEDEQVRAGQAVPEAGRGRGHDLDPDAICGRKDPGAGIQVVARQDGFTGDRHVSKATLKMMERRVIVLRCMSCGDTFPAHDDEPIRCPSCGSDNAEVAGEPLL
jgi:hypothetical protein